MVNPVGVSLQLASSCKSAENLVNHFSIQYIDTEPGIVEVKACQDST